MSRPMSIYATLDDWIAQDAIPFTLDAPGSFEAAVDVMIATLGDDVELLGLGEALHGGEALLILRNRLFQHLVEAHGYTAIALESSFTRAYIVDEYVSGRGSASSEKVQDAGFSHVWRFDANRELVEWMRAYNAEPAHHVPLRFYGFDSPTESTDTDSPRQSLVFALDYLAAINPTGSAARRERIVSLLGDDADWENPAAIMDPAQAVGLSPDATALRIETEELLSELGVRRPELVAGSDESRYAEAVQYASVARQLLNYHAALARDGEGRYAAVAGIRDAMMADNLAYIVARERDRGKVLVHAHNAHLQRGQIQWQGPYPVAFWPAGAHLASMFGPRYAAIGTGVGVSEANGIGQPEADTLEARLTAAPGPGRFIPTHRGQGLPTAAVASLPTRSGSATNGSYFALTPQSLTDFDALIVLDATPYARGFPPLSQWAGSSAE